MVKFAQIDDLGGWNELNLRILYKSKIELDFKMLWTLKNFDYNNPWNVPCFVSSEVTEIIFFHRR